MEELNLIQRVEAEIKNFTIQANITPDFFRSMVMEEKVLGEFATTLALRVVLTLMGRLVVTEKDESKVVHKSEEIGYYTRPLSWWDGLKCLIFTSDFFGWMFPERALKDWVKYETLPKHNNYITHETRDIRHYHMCPLPGGVATDKSNISFMMWDQPFVGSQREYVLLRIIAKQCLTMLQDTSMLSILNKEFLEALSEYITEITRYPVNAT